MGCMAVHVAEALPRTPATRTRESLIRASRSKTWVLALTLLASFMVALDALVVSTALSTIRLDFGTTIEALEWTINAYNLSFAVLLLTGTALGDRFGRRRVLIAGLTVFTLASIGCALAPDANWLITRERCRAPAGPWSCRWRWRCSARHCLQRNALALWACSAA